MNNNFKENFSIVYNNLYKLHPQKDNKEFKFRYLKVDWFFPNHIHNVLINIKKIGDGFFENIDIEAALYGGLMHDAGLVYERNSSDPKGHENRSVEYARKELEKIGYDYFFIEKVCECIKATEPDYNSDLPEAILVRNADAYSHIMSMHFFAKANFSNDIHEYVEWFDKKINSSFEKLTIKELIDEVSFLVNLYNIIIKNYYTNKGSEGDAHFVLKLKN